LRYVLAVKAAVSMAAGLAITFSQSHSASVGLLVLAIFSIGYAVLAAAAGLRFEPAMFLTNELPLSVAALVIGVFALINQSGGQASFVILVASWGLFSGGLELWLALRVKLKSVLGREHLISASLALLLSLVFLAAQLDVVSAVGFFSAYLILSSVHLGIAAFSPKS
jgi:hypothetical protein